MSTAKLYDVKLEVQNNEELAKVYTVEERTKLFPRFDKAVEAAKTEIERRHLKLVGFVVTGNSLYARGSLQSHVLNTIHYSIV